MDKYLMTQDVAMRFIVWSYFFHGIRPEKNVSYADCGKFSERDVTHLDQLRDTLFRTVTEQSVFNACAKLDMAVVMHEQSPYPQRELDKMFAKEV